MNVPLFTRAARAMSVGVGANTSSFIVPVLARSETPVRIPIAVLPARPQTRGDRDYLRALRAAEMKAWQASGGDALNLNNTP